MGVKWQNTELYQNIKFQEKETGVSYSSISYANNIDAQQRNSIWVSIISQIPNFFFSGGEAIATLAMNRTDDTGSATDVKSQTDMYSTFNQKRQELEDMIDNRDVDGARALLDELKTLSGTNITLKKAYNCMETRFKEIDTPQNIA